VLRQFLHVYQPLDVGPVGGLGQLSAGGQVLPVGVVAGALACLDAVRMLRSCSAVCHAMRAAVMSPRCWLGLRFRSSCAERWLDSLLQLLAAACSSMQALALDFAFENPRLAVSLPARLAFCGLNRLSLRLGDAEAENLGAELLECIESPGLQRVTLEGGVLAEGLLSALCRVSLASTNGLLSLRLLWEPHRPMRVDQRQASAIMALQEASCALEELELGLAGGIRGKGVPRTLAPLDPPQVAVPRTQPLLANAAALASLRRLTFDFLSDDVLICLRDLDDRSLCLQSAKLSGLSRQLAEPDEALVLLLSKLGDGLEELELLVELEAEVRCFAQGVLHARIGQLPRQWQGREVLRLLALNWTAFDCEGVRCLVEHCPRLQTLWLDRSEYWTDATVSVIAEGLPELRHFRLRSSALLSDQALYTLAEAADRFASLELELSHSMSSYALDHLRQRLHAEDPSGLWNPTSAAMNLIAAAAGEPNPTATVVRCSGRSPSLRLLDREGEEGEEWQPQANANFCVLEIGRW